MSHAYTTIEELKSILELPGVDARRDAWFRNVIEGVTRRIDRTCGRNFRVITSGTKYFTPEFYDLLFIPDLLAITTLKTDEDADGTYEYTWTTSDYHLEPSNATLDERPYTRIKTKSRGDYSFPKIERSVEIVGKWGFWEEFDTIDAALTATVSSSVTEWAVDDLDAFEVGWTLLVESEQVYIRGKNANTSSIVVERAQNNSAAASHTTATTLRRYVYPEPIVTAATLWANRIISRAKTPLGIVNVPGDIGWRAVYIPRVDVDVMDLLKDYRKGTIL